MEIKWITADYAVGAQIRPSDMQALAEAGFASVINNRPDAENPPDLQSNAMRSAADKAGLAYIENPVINEAMTMDMVKAQAEALEASNGPVFAWCRSGTRSSIVWALSKAGELPSAEILKLLSDAGYDLPQLGPQLDALAAGR